MRLSVHAPAKSNLTQTSDELLDLQRRPTVLRLLGGPLPALIAAGLLLPVEALTHARTLTELDSFNLARGLELFDPTLHRPHPPGYPLVVLSAHLASWAGRPIGAYLVVAILFAMLSVVATWALAEELFGRGRGTIASSLLASTPLFLYYGGVVSVYLPEVALGTLFVLLCARVARQAGRWSDLSLLPALAVTSGFRPSGLPLLLPVMLLALFLGRPPLRRFAVSGVMGSIVFAAWVVPTLAKSHGLHAYRAASKDLYASAARRTSLFYGAPLSAALRNALFVVAASVMCSLPSLIVVIVSRVRRPTRSSLTPWLLLIAWIAPYFLLFSLVHFGKPAYVLAYVPALTVGGAGLAANLTRAQLVSIAAGVLMLIGYVALARWPIPDPAATWWPTARNLRIQDAESRSIPAISASCPPGSCTIVSLPGAGRFYCHSFGISGLSEQAVKPRILRPNELISSPPDGEVLWVGGEPPGVVRRLATPEGGVGSWSLFRSSPQVTVAILRAGVPSKSC